MNKLPQVLKGLRQKQKLSQQEIAKTIETTQRTYAHYEAGDRQPDIETLIKLAEFYRVPLDILVGRYSSPDIPEPKERKTRKRNPISKYETERTKEITP